MRLGSRDTALAVLAILVAIVLAILAAAQVASGVVIGFGLGFVLLTLLIFVPALVASYPDWVEERQRGRLRKLRHLRVVEGEISNQPPSKLPNDVYGFEEVFAFSGLKDGVRAKVKPDTHAPDGHQYPIEVHKLDDETFAVGYLSEQDHEVFLTMEPGRRVTLWLRRQDDASTLVEVPLSRWREEASDGDGSLRNAYRLHLLPELA